MEIPRLELDLHPRTLRRNIWHALLCASDQEIHEGMHFYEGAYGLCKFFASLHPDVTPSQVAGIYSALSPMNTWDTNVSNVLDVLRDGTAASVNTTDINFHKAIRIRLGNDPLSVLSGRKVAAFYRAIANPDDTTCIPVDRHLINLALGIFPSKNKQSTLAGNEDIYSKVESAYQDLGRRERIGNRLASIAWFVQRRISRAGQAPIIHPGSPVCCNRPMHSHGSWTETRGRKFRCPRCSRVKTVGSIIPDLMSVSRRTAQAEKEELLRRVKTDYPIEFPLSIVQRAPIVYLPRNHPHRNSAGWQYLSRHIVMEHTGEILRRDEHVHHDNRDKTDCRKNNLKVMLEEHHGRLHGRCQLLYMLRDHAGRWASSVQEPVPF